MMDSYDYGNCPIRTSSRDVHWFDHSIGCLMPTSNSQVGLGIRIIEIPSAVQNDPQSGIYIVDRLLPSTVVSERIEVSNSTNAPMMVSLYPSAATNINGVFTPSSGEIANELTSWTSILPSSGVIAAHGTLDATVTISVPANVISGEQYGVIWASASTPTHAFGIVSVSRVGIRMYDPIGADLETASSTTTTLGTSHPSWTLDVQWTAIGLLFIAVAALAAKENSRIP